MWIWEENTGKESVHWQVPVKQFRSSLFRKKPCRRVAPIGELDYPIMLRCRPPLQCQCGHITAGHRRPYEDVRGDIEVSWARLAPVWYYGKEIRVYSTSTVVSSSKNFTFLCSSKIWHVDFLFFIGCDAKCWYMLFKKFIFPSGQLSRWLIPSPGETRVTFTVQ